MRTHLLSLFLGRITVPKNRLEPEQMDHDQKFKTLIEVFFADFSAMFLPQYHPFFDFSEMEWLKQELFLSPPDGKKVELDVVCKIKVKGYPTPNGKNPSVKIHTIVFIEIESPTTTTSIEDRIGEYIFYLRRQHKIDVLPVVLFLNVGKGGIRLETVRIPFLFDNIGELKYWAIGLPALDAVEYLNKGYPLGYALTSLMNQTKNPFEIAKEALEKIVVLPINDRDKHLLMDCVQAYTPISEEQQKELDNMVRIDKDGKLIPRNKTSWDRAVEEGAEKADRSRLKASIRKVVLNRLGETVAIELTPKVESIEDIKTLETLFDSALTDSVDEFRKHLADSLPTS